MKASVIILTYNQLEDGTKPCIESIYKHTNPRDFELIIVDNASQDGTVQYIKSIQAIYPNIKVCLNSVNKGYAGGNNDGLRIANGDYLILLNNDTLVTAGWLDALLRPFETDSRIGLIGPITNLVGNEQIVKLPNLNEQNFEKSAERYVRNNYNVLFETKKLGFFCVAIKREVFKKVGFLDECFGIGMFEDDDYCLRTQSLGYKLVVTEECFVYHKGSLSFSKLQNHQYQDLVKRNKDIFYKKHNEYWTLSDIALSYLNKMNSDLSCYVQSNNDIDPNITRILVRIESFKELLGHMKTEEVLNNRLGLDEKEAIYYVIRKKWKNRYKNFKEQFINGNTIEKIKYLKKIKNKIVSPKDNDIHDMINKICSLRKHSSFLGVIIIPATIDFSYMPQRPQWLARSLAKLGYLVIYGTLNCQTDSVDFLQKINNNLYILNEIHFPLLTHLATKEETTYFCMWPTNLKHVDYLPFNKLIYDYMDDISLLYGSYEELKGNHLTLLERADLITVSATKLKEEIPLKYSNKLKLLNNAVSEDFIQDFKNSLIAEEIIKIRGNESKIIGYYGALASWFDFELIDYIATNRKDYTFILIGPIFDVEDKVENLKSKHKNIHIYPKVEQDKLIQFLKGFDVCIIPFKINSITEAVSPVKLFEYMSGEKPIVSTNLHECNKYKSVLIGENFEDFIQKVDIALDRKDDLKYKKLAKNEAIENTWEARAGMIDQFIRES